MSGNDVRNLVTVRRVSSVTPIANADAIECAKVDGWTVVVRKGQFKPGDICVYFEIDCALPLDGPFGFLADRSPKKEVDGVTCHVLRTAKLRGQISQGLIMKPEELGLDFDLWDTPSTEVIWNTDITQWAETRLGVKKYEKPLPQDLNITSHFPTHLVRKTDSERVQNLTDAWDAIKELHWSPTEKIDGSSATYVMTETGELLVCSRNYTLKEGSNFYWDIARQYDLANLLEPGWSIQGEIFGEGIQGNRLGLKGKHFRVFALNGGDGDGPYNLLEAFASSELELVPFYSLSLPDTIEEAVEQADGIKSLISPDRLAEGIVWTTTSPVPELNDRSTFKVISNKWLLKEKD